MFTGEVRHQLDAKNRIRIPAKYKAELGEEFVFVKGFECINVYPKSVIEKIINDMAAKINRFDKKESEAFSKYLRGIVTPIGDTQGRIVLDRVLKQHAKIDKNIVTIGAFDHLEIFAEEIADRTDDGGLDFDQMMQVFAEKQIEG